MSADNNWIYFEFLKPWILLLTGVIKLYIFISSFFRYLFHTVINDGLVYLCMADKDMGKTIPYAFLHEVSSFWQPSIFLAMLKIEVIDISGIWNLFKLIGQETIFIP